MKLKSIILIILLLLLTAGLAQSSDLLSQGIWQIVELEPKGDNPLNKMNIYYVLMPNETLIEVSIPKDGKLPTKTKIFNYKYIDGILTTTDKQDISEHKITQTGSRIKMEVPFGAVWLLKVPNNTLNRTR
jgi:hypothetical protein